MANKRVYFDFPSNKPIVDDSVPKLTWLQWFQRIQFIVGEPKVWQNVTADRALNTPYVNGTGREISVNISYTSTIQDTIRLDVDGVRLHGNTAAIGNYTSINAQVPNGATYMITTFGGVATLQVWIEYR